MLWFHFTGHVKRVFWISCILFVYAAAIYQSYDVITRYMRRDISVTVEIVHAQELDFPAVTVCNMSPIKKSALEKYIKELEETPPQSKDTTRRKRKRRKRSETA